MILNIFKSPVLIEEKIDGSQFSFGYIDNELRCRSKGKELYINAPEKMFEKGVESVKSIQSKLHRNWIYRAEYLQKPKHNVLCYDRIPKNHLIIFDITKGIEDYLSYEEKKAEAERIELEVVPKLYEGMINSETELMTFLETISILGGSTIEGVVVKNYNLFTSEKKIAIGKYVSERFKEKHNKDWKKQTSKSIIEQLIEEYKTKARWEKAVIHLRERGELKEDLPDIGLLIKEVPRDVLKECKEEIKEKLFKHFWGHIRRGITGGLPEWYKKKLMKKSF
jgi:hypothetical protein